MSVEAWGHAIVIAKYASIPLVSALVGYLTNVAALKMMFYPVAYRGIWRPYLGWQGVVPRRASKMTGVAVDTLTTSLIDEHEIFARIDSAEIAAVLCGPIGREIGRMADAIMTARHPRLWSRLPLAVQRQIISRLQARSGHFVAAVNDDMRSRLDYLFDLDGMIVRALVQEKELLNQMFLQIGRVEFRFIARSGFWFGLGFGLIQMAIWIVWQAWWLLPLFGLLVGWATNWLALKMIFTPRRARRLGPWRIQGLFFRRQTEVSDDYARFVTERILTPAALLSEFMHGPYAEKFRALVVAEVDRSIDDALAATRHLFTWTLGATEYEQIKAAARAETIARMPVVLANAEPYLARVLAIRETLSEKLRALSPAQFEAMLRPAFEEDEWILIAVGAVLGLALGWFQLFFVFYDVFVARFGALF